MLSTFALSFEMNDADGLEAREWRAIALGALARSGDGLVVCDRELYVVHTSPRASQLLKRLSTDVAPASSGARIRTLPESLAAAVRSQLAGGGARTEHVPLTGGNSVEVDVSTIRFAGRASIAIYLREEVLRDDDLYAVLKERFSVSMRGVQLAVLIKKGLTNRQIAERLTLAESTVKIYVHQLYRACGVSSRTGLLALLDRLP